MKLLNQQVIWEYHWSTHKMTNMTTPHSKVHFSISYFLLNQEFINKSGSFIKQEKLQLLYLHFQIIDPKIPSVILWASNSFNLWLAVLTLLALITAGKVELLDRQTVGCMNGQTDGQVPTSQGTPQTMKPHPCIIIKPTLTVTWPAIN